MGLSLKIDRMNEWTANINVNKGQRNVYTDDTLSNPNVDLHALRAYRHKRSVGALDMQARMSSFSSRFIISIPPPPPWSDSHISERSVILENIRPRKRLRQVICNEVRLDVALNLFKHSTYGTNTSYNAGVRGSYNGALCCANAEAYGFLPHAAAPHRLKH